MNLPPILSSRTSDDHATFEFSIPSELDAFRGHFPDIPVLPGVTQIDWAIQLAARSWALPAVARDFQAKFRKVIRPDSKLTLALQLDRPKARLFFEYRIGEQIMSSGRIALEQKA